MIKMVRMKILDDACDDHHQNEWKYSRDDNDDDGDQNEDISKNYDNVWGWRCLNDEDD